MNIAPRIDLTIQQGATYSEGFQWQQERKVFVPITALALLVPARLTAPAHAMPDGWPCAVTGSQSCPELNTTDEADGLYVGARIDADTVELVNVNASDFGSYNGDAYLEYRMPYDLSVATYTEFTCIIRAAQGSASVLDTLTKTNTRITVDNTLKLLTLNTSAAATGAYTFTEGWYDLDATHVSGRIDRISYGAVRVQQK